MTDSGHGRIEVRAAAAAPCEPEQTGMPAVRQAIAVHATRTVKKTKQTSQCERRFITSLTAQEARPQRLSHLIRAHWGIENRNHWRRDACWGEDTRCRLRNANAACALALLRSALLLPALTTKTTGLPDLAERCAASRRYAMNLFNKRHFDW
jgi:predicted transposase YbfD/YdcC